MGIESKDEMEFECIYEANKDLVFRTAMYYSGNYHIAQEISQTAFLKLYMKLEEGIDPEKIRPWLLKTTKNLAINSKKKRSHEIASEDIELISSIFESEPSAEDVVINSRNEKEIIALCNDIFAGLHKENLRWHEAITLVYSYKMSQKEVAKTMGMDVEALHSMLYRTRKWIFKKYEKRYDKLQKNQNE